MNKLTEGFLSEVQAYQILEQANIPIAPYRIIKDLGELEEVDLEYPLVLKIISPDIIHKTDAGCIRTNLRNRKEVELAWEEILRNAQVFNPQARLEGILAQVMISKGHQVIVSFRRDPQFGLLLMVGMGGIFVEIIKDTVWRLAPIDKDEALDMIKQLKTYPLLEGVRGQEKMDIQALAELLVKVNCLAEKSPDILEMEMNPVFVLPGKGGTVTVDALARIREVED